jgi:hypothetical protein
VQTLFRILKYNKKKDMNEKYYVVFDGTSAYIVGEEDIKEIETNQICHRRNIWPIRNIRRSTKQRN